MRFNRREFVLTSSSALAAGVFGPSMLFAQQAAPAPPTVPVFAPLRRNVGTFSARGGTMGWLVVAPGRAGDRQPVRRHLADVPRRHEVAHPAQVRPAAQHAPPSRSHGRQQGAATVGDQDRGAPERAGAPAQAGRGPEVRGQPGLRRRDLHRHVAGHGGRRSRVRQVLRRGPHQRRRRVLLRAREHRAHGRPDVAPAAPARGPALGRVDPQLARRRSSAS